MGGKQRIGSKPQTPLSMQGPCRIRAQGRPLNPGRASQNGPLGTEQSCTQQASFFLLIPSASVPLHCLCTPTCALGCRIMCTSASRKCLEIWQTWMCIVPSHHTDTTTVHSFLFDTTAIHSNSTQLTAPPRGARKGPRHTQHRHRQPNLSEQEPRSHSDHSHRLTAAAAGAGAASWGPGTRVPA
jgi:hypothetical protein